MNDNERIPGTDVKPVPLPATEPESEAALAIKPGAWVEICIPTNAALIEHPELQGAVLQVQSHDCTAHEVTAGDIIWPAHNVRVVEHPSDWRAKYEALERDYKRVLKAKGAVAGDMADLLSKQITVVSETVQIIEGRIDKFRSDHSDLYGVCKELRKRVAALERK